MGCPLFQRVLQDWRPSTEVSTVEARFEESTFMVGQTKARVRRTVTPLLVVTSTTVRVMRSLLQSIEAFVLMCCAVYSTSPWPLNCNRVVTPSGSFWLTAWPRSLKVLEAEGVSEGSL